jgi:hypothetical protein
VFNSSDIELDIQDPGSIARENSRRKGCLMARTSPYLPTEQQSELNLTNDLYPPQFGSAPVRQPTEFSFLNMMAHLDLIGVFLPAK